MRLGQALIHTLPAAALLAAAGAAHGETTASAVASFDTRYGSNPYLGGGSNLTTGAISAAIAPTVTVSGPTSKVSFGGTVDHVVFTNHFKDLTSWSLGSNATVDVSSNAKIGASLDYSSRVRSGHSAQIVQDIGTGTDVELPDGNEAETAGIRSNILSGSIGYDTSLSRRDTLSIQFHGSQLRYDTNGASLSNHDLWGMSTQISHVVNQRLSVGARLDFTKVNYKIAGAGSSQHISPHGYLSYLISPKTKLNLSAGATFLDSNRPGAGSSKPYLAAQASICHDGARSQFCAFGSRSVSASAYQSSTALSALGSSYSYKLSPRKSISLSSQYSNSELVNAAVARKYSYLQASANYQQQLNQRLSFSVNVRYTDPIKSIGARQKSFFGGVGIRYRLGR